MRLLIIAMIRALNDRSRFLSMGSGVDDTTLRYCCWDASAPAVETVKVDGLPCVVGRMVASDGPLWCFLKTVGTRNFICTMLPKSLREGKRGKKQSSSYLMEEGERVAGWLSL